MTTLIFSATWIVKGQGYSSGRPDGSFPKSFGFILHIRLVKSPLEALGKGRGLSERFGRPDSSGPMRLVAAGLDRFSIGGTLAVHVRSPVARYRAP